MKFLVAASLLASASAFSLGPAANTQGFSSTALFAEESGEIQPLRIGTRGSPLAMAQAFETRRRLQENFPEMNEDGAIEICVMKTQGDMILDKSLMELGGKGLFTKELDVALLGDEVDICVHSMKDVPTWLPDGTVLPCNFPREETNDAFITKDNKYGSIAELPDGSVIGTASLRRQAQILSQNPTLKCVNFRGNVQTRLRKLNDGVVDATLLAIAGLKRMDMDKYATAVLEWDEMLPAVAQGAIGVQCREGDERALKYINALNHMDTHVCVNCERAFLEALDGNCKTPIAGQARIIDGKIKFRGLIAMPDGSQKFVTESEGAIEDACADLVHFFSVEVLASKWTHFNWVFIERCVELTLQGKPEESTHQRALLTALFEHVAISRYGFMTIDFGYAFDHLIWNVEKMSEQFPQYSDQIACLIAEAIKANLVPTRYIIDAEIFQRPSDGESSEVAQEELLRKVVQLVSTGSGAATGGEQEDFDELTGEEQDSIFADLGFKAGSSENPKTKSSGQKMLQQVEEALGVSAGADPISAQLGMETHGIPVITMKRRRSSRKGSL